MAVLRYDDLVNDLEREKKEKGLTFVTKDDKELLIRPVMLLDDEETKVVNSILPSLQDDSAGFEKRMAGIDRILLAAVDKKEEFKKAMRGIPPAGRIRIFEEWLGSDDELGEASSSES